MLFSKAKGLLLAAALSSTSAAPAGTQITSLPGLANMPSFSMYSGYVTVDQAAGRKNFYWLVESGVNPSTDPLVVWFTGGPGCSSLYALLTEHGPFRPNTTDPTQLYENPYSWNLAGANMLYIEQPSGVGFSWAADGNYTTGDDAAAADNYAFVVGFLQQYPEYVNRPLFISGESYAGHYVPQLAMKIYQNPVPGVLNLQGFMVGNPSFDSYYDSQNYWPFMAHHGLASTVEFEQASQLCNGTFAGTLSPQCSAALSAIQANLPYINPYNIYASCDGPPSLDGSCFTAQAVMASSATAAANAGASSSSDQSSSVQSEINLAQTVVPCMNVTPAVIYLNQPAVKAAIHVDPANNHSWDVCSVYVNYTQYAPTVAPIYLALKDQIDILVYSGDVDSCVPYLGTEAAVDSLGWTVSLPYKRWFITDSAGRQQIAGYVRQYFSETGKIASYATVKGAGHMVPTYQPAAAVALFQRYLQGGNF